MPDKLTRGRWLLSVLGATTLAQEKAEEKTKQLSAEEAEKALQAEDVFLLDVREPHELEEFGSIKGYVNIPLGQLENRLSEIPKNKTIVTL